MFFFVYRGSYAFRSIGILCQYTRNARRVNGSQGISSGPVYITLSRDRCGYGQHAVLRVVDVARRRQEYQFVVCIHRPLMTNISDYQMFVEQVEVSSLFGADKFVVYNLSGGPALKPYIDYYVKAGKMDFINWPLPLSYEKGLPIKAGAQLSLINDCLYRYMYRTKYLILTNLDEFIVPRQHDNWVQMLNASRCRNKTEANVRNVFFPLNVQKKLKYGNISSPVTVDSVLKQNVTAPCKARSKSIVLPQNVFEAKVHAMTSATEELCCLETELGLLQHYRMLKDMCGRGLGRCLTDTYLNKFRSRISSSVEKVYNAIINK